MKKFLIILCLIIIMQLSIKLNIDKHYIVNKDKKNLTIKNTIIIPKINNIKKINEVTLSNIKTRKTIKLNNSSIKKVIIKNCSLKKLVLPKNTQSLEINSSEIKDYHFLLNLKSLDELIIKNCNITNLKNYKYAKKITTLMIYNCPLTSLSGISNLKNIDYLAICESSLESISNLKKLKNLDTLILTNTYVKSLSPIKNSKITRLYLSNSNNILDLDIITTLKSLKILQAENLEVACSNEIINYIKNNNIKSNLNLETLKLKNEAISINKKILNDNMNIKEKIKAITKYVLDSLEYDYDAINNNKKLSDYNNEGLKYALKGKGVCRNYTSLTKALLTLANINNYEIENENHIWNLIEIDNNFYFLDTTWLDIENEDDIEKSIYYMNNNKQFDNNHLKYRLPISYNASSSNFFATY